MEGWIKLHRKMLENPIVCKDSDYLSVWIYILLHASHGGRSAMFKGKKITLKQGQLITGRLKIATELCINESKVKRILKAFKSDQQIDQQTSTKNSLITVLNWEEYQDSDQQVTNKRPTNDQQVTIKRPTSDQQVTTSKNERMKELKNNKKSIVHFVPPTVDDVRGYCNERGYKIDEERFVNFYECKGWMVGKNKMKDWKAAVRNWSRQDKSSTKQRPVNKFQNFEGRTYDMDDLERRLLEQG